MSRPDDTAGTGERVKLAVQGIRNDIGFALAEKNIPREPTWTLLVPQALDNIDAGTDALVAAVREAEAERDEWERQFQAKCNELVDAVFALREAEARAERAERALRQIENLPASDFVTDSVSWKRAPLERNEEMARRGADLCVCFWDQRSTGTAHMRDQARRHGIAIEMHIK